MSEGETNQAGDTEAAVRALADDVQEAAKLAADSAAFERDALAHQEQLAGQPDVPPAAAPRRFKCKLGGEIYTGEPAVWLEAAEACISGEGRCQSQEIGLDDTPLPDAPIIEAPEIEVNVVPPEPAGGYVCHKGHRQQGGFFHKIPPNPAMGFPEMRFGPACRQCLFEWIVRKFRTRPVKRTFKSVPANDVTPPAEVAPEPEPA